MGEEELNSGAAAERPIQLTAFQNANLALLLVIAALLGVWLYAYTEWIPRLRESLSGEGALFWVSGIAALVWGSISKPGRKLLLYLLAFRGFPVALILLLLVFVWFAASHGALRLELTKDFREEPVEVFDSERHSLGQRIPPKDGEFRELVPASLLGSSSVWIAVKNRPYEPVPFSGVWRRPLISVPSQLKREVVLIYGADSFLRFTANGPGATLTIDIQRRNRSPLHAAPVAYKGQALWLGCRRDVELPAAVKAALQ